jgi:hypothetical protein
MTQERVTQGMRGTMEDVREWKESVEENARACSEALEQRLVQFETAKLGLQRGDRLKPAHLETFSGDHSVGKEWIWTILHYIDL